jgi:phage shock protein C
MAERLPVKERVARQGLVRPRTGRVLAGVCAGLAKRFGISPTVVRVLFVVSLILPGPQALVYIVLWILMPSE